MTSPYPDFAAELRRIADALDTLAAYDLPRPYVSIDIHPHGTNDAEVIRAVDTVLLALMGLPGSTYPVSGGYHHGHNGRRGDISVGVYDRVSDPTGRERDAELARLRAEVAALTASAVVTG